MKSEDRQNMIFIGSFACGIVLIIFGLFLVSKILGIIASGLFMIFWAWAWKKAIDETKEKKNSNRSYS